MVLQLDDDEVVKRIAGVEVDHDVLIRMLETVFMLLSVMIKLSLILWLVSMTILLLCMISSALLDNVITEIHKVLTRCLAIILGRQNEPFYLLVLHLAGAGHEVAILALLSWL